MELEPLKHKKRKLTRFLCQELLLDYVQGTLDQERRRAVEEFLPTCKDTQKEFEILKRGYDYSRNLHSLQIQKSLVDELFAIQSPLDIVKHKLSWKNWPETVRWVSEAFMISIVVALFAVLIPWPKLAQMMPKRSQDLVLAEAGREKLEKQSHDNKSDAPKKAETASKVADVQPTPVEVAATAPTPVEEKKPTVVAPAPVKVPEKSSTAGKIATKIVSNMAIPEEGNAITEKPKGKGELYRGFMNIQNLEDVAPQITQEIIALGGEKAGQVELGWKKPGGHYYHFTMSESDYDKLLTSLRTFGPVRISSEPHPRVMPKGKIRIILWVEGPAGSGDE